MAVIDEVMSYNFQDLYQSSNPEDVAINNVVNCITSTLFEDDIWMVDRPFSEQEIHDSLFSMGHLKALGPDGYLTGFFQK